MTKTRTVSISLPKELIEIVQLESAVENRTVSNFIQNSLMSYLAAKGKTAAKGAGAVGAGEHSAQ